MSLPLPALVNQLRAAYPAASLLSELLAIESNVFVVRALIQIGSLTLATGMAAASDVETAEDRAKCRAIEALMLPPAPAAIPAPAPSTIAETAIAPLPNPTADFSSRVNAPAVSPLSPISSSPPISANAERFHSTPSPIAEPQPQAAPLPPTETASPDNLTDWDNPLRSSRSGSNIDLNFDLNTLLQDSTPETSVEAAPPAADLFAAVNSDPAAPIDPPINLSDLNLTKLKLPQTDDETGTAAGSEKPARRKSAAAAPPEPAPPVSVETVAAEIDRSGEIARIGVEMKRLGWDTKKGRDHLQRTYGKRSRQELNDDELMDFLHYLETQPSSAQMPF